VLEVVDIGSTDPNSGDLDEQLALTRVGHGAPLDPNVPRGVQDRGVLVTRHAQRSTKYLPVPWPFENQRLVTVFLGSPDVSVGVSPW